MKCILRFTIFSLFVGLMVSCGGSKVSGSESTEYLFLSQGGGVTGKYEGYILYDDGRVETSGENLDEKPMPSGEISKKEAAKLFAEWELLSKQQLMPFKPGNMNYKIGHGSGDDMQVIDWSDSQTINPEIQEFFNDTFSILKSAK